MELDNLDKRRPAATSGQGAARGLSRRDFLAAVAGAAVATAAADLAGCDPEDSAEDDVEALQLAAGETPPTISVSAEQLVEATNFDEHPLEERLQEAARHSLPFGTVLYQINAAQALCLVPRSEGKSLVDLHLLDLTSGEMTLLLDKPAGPGRGHADAIIYNARASESLLIWTEVDISDLHWQVFVAPIEYPGYVSPPHSSDQPAASQPLPGLGSATSQPPLPPPGTPGVLGPALLVDEGGPDYEVPLVAVTGNKAYWTVMPNPDGPAMYEDSYLKATVIGWLDPTVIYTSHGRMVTTPLVNQGVLTFAPRVDTKNVYYKMTALSTLDDRELAYQVLPMSVRPLEAIFLNEGFCFSIENNYTHAGGLGFYGTYMPLTRDRWLHLFRKPSSPPAMLAGHLVLKSSVRVIGIDASTRTYYSIPPLADSADYGDIMASYGQQQNLVVYSNVRPNTALAVPQGVVRVFVPVEPEGEG